MEMQDVLSKLKKIENPNEDQARAIENAEKMNNPTNPTAENPLMPQAQQVSATGQEVYTPVAEESPTEYARLAGVQTLNVQSDAPETTNEDAISDLAKKQVDAEYKMAKKQADAEQKMAKKIGEDDEESSKEQAESYLDYIDQMCDKIEDKSVAYQIQNAADDLRRLHGIAPTMTRDKYNEQIGEAKPDFLDLDKDGDKKEPMKKAAKDKEKKDMKEDDTTPEQYEKIEKVEEAYDPSDINDKIAGHEKAGHKVKKDSPSKDSAGFTVTYKDGKRTHYKYTKDGVKATSMEPVDPLVDPDAEKRGRGRPKKESAELNLDAMMEDFENKLKERLDEGVNVTQSIDDQGNENVSISANGDHVDMIKNLLKLSGMRSDGYKEYKGEEEPVEEERDIEYTNSPREKVASADTQMVKMTGGVNGPRPASAAKSNSNALYQETKNKDLEESMMDLYKEYKESE